MDDDDASFRTAINVDLKRADYEVERLGWTEREGGEARVSPRRREDENSIRVTVGYQNGEMSRSDQSHNSN